jgi:uncharacterized membrane protein YeaQ/YmgE (transglycosylase-associated protein family)
MARAAHPLPINLRRHTMSWLGWIVLGLIAGYIASKNKDASGIALDILLGIVGASVGGYVFTHMGAEGIFGSNIYSMFVAMVGAIAVLIIYHLIAGKRALR